MPGVRRGTCLCCETEFCGINNLIPSGIAQFCSPTTTDNSCPSTLAVNFSIPSEDLTLDCSGTPYFYATFTSWTGSISVSNVSGTDNLCSYVGSQVLSISIPWTLCGTTSGTFNQRTISVRLISGGANILNAGAIMLSPCGSTATDPSPPKCAGICVEIVDQFSDTTGGSQTHTHYYSLGYKAYEIDTCIDVPCYMIYGGTPDLNVSGNAGGNLISGVLIT
jgi:hypothetical protein